MTTLATLVVSLVADAGQYVDGLDQAESKTRGFIGSLGKNVQTIGKLALGAGAAIATGLVGVAVATIPKAIDAASDYEESLSKVGVVFGDSAGLVEAFSETSARSLGIAQRDALAAAGTFGNLFVSMGLAQDASAGMSTDLVQLAADLASFNNLDPTEVLDKLRAGITGEAEPLKTLGINMTQAAVEAKALELGLAATASELDAAALLQARYALIMEQSTLAQGDFARTSDGLANTQRILGAVWSDMLQRIGGVLLPVLLRVLQQLTPILFDKILPAFESIAGAFGDFVTRLQDGVDPLTALQVLLMQLLPPEISAPIIQFLGQVPALLAQLGDGIGQVVAFLQPYITAAAEWIGQNMTLQDLLTALGIAIASVVVPALVSIVSAAAPVIGTALLLIAAVTAIRLAWENDFLGIRTFIETTLAAIQAFWTAHGEAIIATVTAFLNGVADYFTWAFGQVQLVFAAFKAAFEGDWTAFGENLRAVWDNAWALIAEIGQLAWNAIVTFFTDTDWGSVGQAIIAGIANGITAGVEWIKTAAGNAAQAALDAAKGFLGIQSPSKAFAELGKLSTLGFAQGLSDVSPITAAAEGVGSAALGAVGNSIDQRRYEKHLHVTTVSPAESLVADFDLLGVMA